MVRVGVIGTSRVAKSTIAFALDEGHEVVCLAEHPQEFEYFAHENLTVVDGSCVNAPDIERVVLGGVAALDHLHDSNGKIIKSFYSEGKIRRFVSTESLSTVATRFSFEKRDGKRSGKTSSAGSSGRHTPVSGATTPNPDAIQRNKSSGIRSNITGLTNDTNSSQILINRGISSCTGISSDSLSMCSENDFLKVINKVQHLREEEEQAMHQKKACDVIVLAVSDQRGSYKHELIYPALQVVMGIKPAPKRVIVVTQNGCGTSMFTGNPLRQAVPFGQDLAANTAKNFIEEDCILGGGVWEIPTWKDLERADAFVCKKMKELRKASDTTETETTKFLLVRPNSMSRENNTEYFKNSRRNTYTASHSSGFMDNFVKGINSGDVGRFIADHLEDQKYDGKPVHLYRKHFANAKA